MARNLKINILAKDKTKAALNGVRGRLAGLKNAVFSLKGAFDMREKISNMCNNSNNWSLNFDYHFGGFGKTNRQLDQFIKEFYINFNIPRINTFRIIS